MQTNQITLYTALLLGTLTASLTYAQNKVNFAKPPIPLADTKAPRGIHKPDSPHVPQAQAITSLTTLTGTVGQLTANDDGLLNGFTLNTGSTTQSVRFGTHLGQRINAVLKAGSRVTVMGYSQTGPQADPKDKTTFQLVKLDAGKTQILDAPPAKPQTSATPTQQTISGNVTDYQLDREGRANGLVLSDQTLVKVPPHVAGQLTTLAPKGSAITVDGYAQPLGEGQLQLQKRTILRASVLTVGDQSYLVR